MGRGSNHTFPSNGVSAQQLLFGKSRHGTQEIKLSKTEQKSQADQAATSAFQARGGRISSTEDGTQLWLLDEDLHREDGPAIVRPDGSEDWFLHGQLHRADGPAIIRADGRQEWWINGKLHREDGPAIELADGIRAWWWKGDCYPTEDMWREVRNRHRSARA